MAQRRTRKGTNVGKARHKRRQDMTQTQARKGTKIGKERHKVRQGK
jgi:hypothetical protein